MGANFNVPANVATPQCLEIVCTCLVAESDASTQEVVNVYHLFPASVLTAPVDHVAIGNAFMTILNGALPACLSVDYSATFATVRMLDDPTALAISLNAPTAGTVTGDRLPSFNSVSVDLFTSARGRCFRGRKHYAPIAESQTLLDELTAGAIANYDTLVGFFTPGTTYSDGGGNYYALGVLSRTNSVLVGPSPSFTYSIVESAVASPRLGTMKRRKQGVGS
jgi:hypothetical protein